MISLKVEIIMQLWHTSPKRCKIAKLGMHITIFSIMILNLSLRLNS